MPSPVFTHTFSSNLYQGSVSINTGLFINNEWVDSVDGDTLDVVNPATGNTITKVSVGSAEDVDIAVKAARKAFKTTWGLHTPGARRGELINKLADLIARDGDKFAAVETLDIGSPFTMSKGFIVTSVVECFRYYAGWAGKSYGKTIETSELKFSYTRHEPIGVCAQIIPWNLPLIMLSWKIAPALATGCTIVLKPSEVTPLTALMFCDLVKEAGIPPGVVNVVNGYGTTVGQTLSLHQDVDKIAFTGSTVVGRKIVKAAAESNLKKVSVELGGKSPSIVFDDADLEQVIKWSAFGIFANAGQVCSAGSRIFVQEGIYDEFLKAFKFAAEYSKLGDPFDVQTTQGPQVSKVQFDRIMGYIDSGKQSGATMYCGGQQHGKEGYFIQPTIFTDVTPEMKIAREEIFGPVVVLIKFKTEEEAIQMANDTVYGLACAVFSQNISRALRVAHSLEGGSAFVNCYNTIDTAVPFGGYKQSGWGRELGEYALENYTQVKAVHVNLGLRL